MVAPDSPTRRSVWGLGRRSISLQLTVLVLVAVLPAFVASIWHLVDQREHDRRVATDQVRQIADNVSGRLLGQFSDYSNTLTLIAGQPLVRAMQPGTCDPLINNFVRLNPAFVTIGTRDRQGNPICTFLPDPPSREQLLQFPWFGPALEQDGFFASNAFFAPKVRRWVTVLTTPVRDDAGNKTGLVALPLDLLSVNQQVMKEVPEGALVTVVDRQSHIIMRSTGLRDFVGRSIAAQLDTAQDVVDTNQVGVFELQDQAGVNRIFAFRRMPGTGWLVFAGLPRDQVFAQADAALRNSVMGSIALLVLALALAWRLSRSIVRPLEAMAATSSRIAAGDIHARVSAPDAPPDVVELGNAFNQMLQARQLAETALRQNEENLSITLQSIGDAVIATDPAGRVVRMNPVAERITGWQHEQANGLPLAQVFQVRGAADGSLPMDPVQQVLQTGQVVALASGTQLISRDGRHHHIADSAAPIRDKEGRIVGVVLVFSDVSEQYRLQQVVVESEERYRALVEASSVAVIVHQHHKVAFVNPAAIRLLGAPDAATLLGRSILDFVHPQQHGLVAQRALQAQHGTSGFPMQEWRYLRVDGSVVDVQAQASLIRMNGEAAVQVSALDVTARKQAEERLRENEARFRALTSLSSDWYWEQDEEFRFVGVKGEETDWSESANQHFLGPSYLGKTRWEMGETHLTQSQWEQHRADLRAHREFRDLQMRFEKPDGSFRWASVSGMPIFDAQGEFRGYRGIGRDITAEKAAQDQINALAFYDALTNLPNRRLLIEQLKQALVVHGRSQQHAALLFIDLDNFKTLNDTLGHETGDQLLLQVAQRLLACVRGADTVARLGGDEFVVMLQGLSAQAMDAAADAEHVGHKILAAFAPPFDLSGRAHRSTPSIGITLFGRGEQSVEDLLKQADLAMYQAKAAGRNTLRMFDEGMQAAVDARAAMESDLRAALEQRQFMLHYQPVVGSDRLINGAEALVRWQHPERGLMPPGQFIPVAEASRLIIPLGLWVLETACAQLALWGEQETTRHLTLAVNVSAHQFMEPDFVTQVEAALRRSGANAERLKMELTESLLADNIEDVIGKMTALRARGVAFSLDDFGTGYSSLSYLKQLPLAHLKIDQSFVRDLLVDPNDAAIARTIVALGESLGLAVIAEGVETDGQHQFLLGIGCETFQGYLFARPLPIAQFDALLASPLPPVLQPTDGAGS